MNATAHTHQHAHHAAGTHTQHTAGTHGGHPVTTPALPGGLQITEAGYTLDLETAITEPGVTDLRFRILGPDGTAVTDFAPIHERELHLIVARRELTGFQHVHPVRDAYGTWTVRIDTNEPGAYRVFADIAPVTLGRTITLGADLAVAGRYEPLPVPAQEAATEVDGYRVTLTGALTTGAGGALTFTVEKDGAAVHDLDPYLGAYGHLVILRAGDLAYVHVHPGGEPGDGVTPAGPAVGFHAAAPGPGTYRLFLDFRHGGVVRTAAFTVTADPVRH
ncbi:hypothetical protein [Nocardia sp. NPDC003963]